MILANNPTWPIAILEATADQLRRRIRRWFKRNTVIGFDNWVNAGKPDFTADDALSVVGSLNDAHNQEILDLLDALRQVEEQMGLLNIMIYVDTVNGDDTTGDGSADAPFATINHVQKLLGQNAYINGKINIFVSAPTGSPLTDIGNWNLRFGPSGQLTIQGTDDPEIKAGGPYTINSWTDLGAAFVAGHACGLAAAPWIADDLQGWFIHMLDGAAEGNYYAIIENSTDNCFCAYTTDPPANGDSFEIVRPGTIIDPADDISFELATNSFDYQDHFFLGGVKLTSKLRLKLKSCNASLGFVYGSDTLYVNYEGDGYNTFCIYNFVDATQIIDTAARAPLPNTYFPTISFSTGNVLKAEHLTAPTISILGAQVTLSDSALQTLTLNGGYCSADRILVRTSVQAVYLATSQFKGSRFYCWGLTNYFVNMGGFGSDLEISDIEVNALAIPAYTLGQQAATNSLVTVANVFVGSTNAVYWLVTAANAAFPLAGAGISDGVGSWCVAN